jgi:hypothetical protein
MEWIEQAVFTSAQTDRGEGYHVAAISPGVCEADMRELGTWGPSHDAMLSSDPGAASVNFHPLPSGAFCVSRTTPAGWEYSGRGGFRVYTQGLIVPPKALSQFANNPFALMRAAAAGGSLRQYEKIPPSLAPFRLVGRAACADSALLTRLSNTLGPEWIAAIVQAALQSVSLAIANGPPAEHVVCGLLNCLPVECRTEFSFSTGLKFSSRRPFRVVALADDVEERQRVDRLYNITVIDLARTPPAACAAVDHWAQWVYRLLKSGRMSFLACQLARRRIGLALADLPALGLQLLEELDASTLESLDDESKERDSRAAGPDNEEASLVEQDRGEESKPCAPVDPAAEQRSGVRSGRRVSKAHPAHPQFDKGIVAAAKVKCKSNAPSHSLGVSDPAVVEKLHRLDELVFDAIAGNESALELLKLVWPALRCDIEGPLIDESREQYLRYALAVWWELNGAEGDRSTARAVQSLEVLSVIFDQV